MLSAAALDRAASRTSLALASAGVSPGTTSHSVPRTARRTRPVLTFNLSFLVSNVHTSSILARGANLHTAATPTLKRNGRTAAVQCRSVPPPRTRAPIASMPTQCTAAHDLVIKLPLRAPGQVEAPLLGHLSRSQIIVLCTQVRARGVSAGARAEETRAVQN